MIHRQKTFLEDVIPDNALSSIDEITKQVVDFNLKSLKKSI